MISRLVYVCCDKCGTPAQPCIGGARDARAVASGEGFIRRNGKDLCDHCAKEKN